MKASGGDRSPLVVASSAIVPRCSVGSGFMYVVALVYIPCVAVLVALVLVVVLIVVLALVLVLVSVFVMVLVLVLVLVLVPSRHEKQRGVGWGGHRGHVFIG